MPTPVNLGLMFRLHDACLGRVSYGLGAKAPSLDSPSHLVKRIDCSGYMRWLLARATDGKLILPDGSWHQRRWCEEHGLYRLRRYSDVTLADPNRLFICFIPPAIPALNMIGHVWLVNDRAGSKGEPITIESRGGRGVDSRSWRSPTLRQWAAAAFELPTVR